MEGWLSTHSSQLSNGNSCAVLQYNILANGRHAALSNWDIEQCTLVELEHWTSALEKTMRDLQKKDLMWQNVAFTCPTITNFYCALWASLSNTGKTVGGPAKCGTLSLEKNTWCAITNNVFPGSSASRALPKTKGALTRLKPKRWNLGFEDTQGSLALPIPISVNVCIKLTSRSEICTTPILILNLVINGINPSGSPARIMQALLQAYLSAEDLHYHGVIFNIGMIQKCQSCQSGIWGGNESAISASKGSIKIIKPTPVAYTVDNFFAGIFVADLDEILKGATLWMLVCGHMVHRTESLKSFTTCVKRYDIANTFAFGAEGLHICLTTFIAAYVECILVEGFLVQEVMTSLLAGAICIDDKASIIMLTYTFFDENQ
ncbi:hypothetical protein C8R48DRAFT_668094 [Suillus tomentosus]|nr:hypothetical protein C8R48DRAFT_668094 [Suillus tomentosus]